MNLSRNKLLIGGAVASVLAIIFFRKMILKNDKSLDIAVETNKDVPFNVSVVRPETKPAVQSVANGYNQSIGLTIIKPDLPSGNTEVNNPISPRTTRNTSTRTPRDRRFD